MKFEPKHRILLEKNQVLPKTEIWSLYSIIYIITMAFKSSSPNESITKSLGSVTV